MNLYQCSRKDRKKFDQMSVVILTPCKDHECSIQFTKSVANLIAYSWMCGLPVYQMGVTERMVVHWARNDLAKIAQSKVNEYTGKQFTHILWLDDDHVFNPDLAVVLARHDVDMVSALYFGRCDRHLPVVYVQDQDSEDEFRHHTLIEPPRSMCKVDAAGFGAMLMRRDVLDSFDYPWFTFENGAGEDFNFCVAARRAGREVWLDGSYSIGHIGDPRVISERTYEEYLGQNQERFADKVKVAV